METVFFTLLIIAAIAFLARLFIPSFGTEEIVTVENETTEEPVYKIVGEIKRRRKRGQHFVIDPIDGTRCYLNSHDNMYEDSAGQIWRVV